MKTEVLSISPAGTLRIFRIVFPCFVLIHGLYRAIGAGHVEGFGGFLDTKGFVVGLAIAWILTIIEIVGSVAIIGNFFVRPLAIFFVCELVAGIIMVHGENGWFVVGGGRNGVEYSLLLIFGYIIVFVSARRRNTAA